MNTESFLQAYNESRNGANEFYRHSMVRRFIYSDGVKACAEAGLYWLLDILATEGANKIRATDTTLATVSLNVKKGKATLKLSGSGDVVFWTRKIAYTDAPDGTWNFLIADDGDESNLLRMILITEY